MGVKIPHFDEGGGAARRIGILKGGNGKKGVVTRSRKKGGKGRKGEKEKKSSAAEKCGWRHRVGVFRNIDLPSEEGKKRRATSDLDRRESQREKKGKGERQIAKKYNGILPKGEGVLRTRGSKTRHEGIQRASSRSSARIVKGGEGGGQPAPSRRGRRGSEVLAAM